MDVALLPHPRSSHAVQRFLGADLHEQTLHPGLRARRRRSSCSRTEPTTLRGRRGSPPWWSTSGGLMDPSEDVRDSGAVPRGLQGGRSFCDPSFPAAAHGFFRCQRARTDLDRHCGKAAGGQWCQWRIRSRSTTAAYKIIDVARFVAFLSLPLCLTLSDSPLDPCT